LENLLSKGALSAKHYKRATALLELHHGKAYGAVAQTLGVSYQTVSGWCGTPRVKNIISKASLVYRISLAQGDQ